MSKALIPLGLIGAAGVMGSLASGQGNKGRRASGPVLIDRTTGKRLKIGDTVTNFRGEESVLTGTCPPPHKSSSTGRVYVKTDGSRYEGEYFPSVYNAEWKDASGKPCCPRPSRRSPWTQVQDGWVC